MLAAIHRLFKVGRLAAYDETARLDELAHLSGIGTLDHGQRNLHDLSRARLPTHSRHGSLPSGPSV